MASFPVPDQVLRQTDTGRNRAAGRTPHNRSGKPDAKRGRLFSVQRGASAEKRYPRRDADGRARATKTTALVSYATDQVDAMKNALPYLFDANADKKTVLSENILQRVENFVLAPAFYDGWSEEKKKNVQKFFNDSAMKVVAPRPGQDLLLF